MATSMSDFAIKASDLFGINKFEEFHVDVLNYFWHQLSDIGKEIVSSRRETRTHDPRYTGPLLYQLS